MRIDIFCDAITNNESQATQMSGCGIILTVKEGKQLKIRMFSFGLGGSDPTLARIQMTRLAFASVLPQFRKSQTFLHLTSCHILDLLAKSEDGYIESVTQYQKEVAEMRRWFEYYNDITLILDASNNMNIIEAQNLARTALQTQKNTDSGTITLS